MPVSRICQVDPSCSWRPGHAGRCPLDAHAVTSLRACSRCCHRTRKISCVASVWQQSQECWDGTVCDGLECVPLTGLHLSMTSTWHTLSTASARAHKHSVQGRVKRKAAENKHAACSVSWLGLQHCSTQREQTVIWHHA